MGRYTGTWLLFYSGHYPLLSFPWIPNLQLSHKNIQTCLIIFFKQIVITLNFFYKEDTQSFDTYIFLHFHVFHVKSIFMLLFILNFGLFHSSNLS